MKNILLIGSVRATLGSLRELLQSQQDTWNVTSADSVAEAAECLSQADFDIVALDASTPDNGGVELLRHVHDSQRLLPSLARISWQLGKIGEGRDEQTSHHVARVGYSARAVAQAMGQDRSFCETLFLAAPLHDIGNTGIPDVILLKREALSPRERDITRQHCAIGERTLREQAGFGLSQHEGTSPPSGPGRPSDPVLEMAASIAAAHHEKWDGTGYPNGLSGERIPLAARIVAICDVFDSLTSQRPFRDSYPFDVALEIIRSASGKHFDPEVSAGFEKALPEIRTIRDRLVDETTCGVPDVEMLWEEDSQPV